MAQSNGPRSGHCGTISAWAFAWARKSTCVVLLCCGGCQSPSLGADDTGAPPRPELTTVRGTLTAASRSLAAYPPGRWRLAESSELDKTRLWISHILIRHRQVPAHWVSLNSIGWASAPDPPDRSREEALELATKVGQLARDVPADFAQLAEKFSEDTTTRQAGGSLGGINAFQLTSWPEVLDAVSTLGYGDVSQPVETAYGFHVFLRRSPPPEGSASGVRIIIGHDDAPWLYDVLARGAIPSRSRAQAFELAQSIYERASSRPDSFDQLVQDHSEHCDAVRGGDFGEWSTNQQTPFPRAVERLSQLEVGEIAPPMDSPFGFEIIRRTAPRPRATYASQRIQVPYDARLPPEAPNSAARVLQHLQNIADELQREPGKFDEYRRKYCCTHTDVWREGQDSALQEQVLARLEVGEIAKAPARLEGGPYAILKRVAPGEWSPERVRFELPAPAKPSLKQYVYDARGAELATLGRAVATDLQLESDVAQRLSRAHDVTTRFASTSSEEERWELFLEVQGNVESLLGPEKFAQYVASVERYVEHQLLWGARARLGNLAAPQVVR